MTTATTLHDIVDRLDHVISLNLHRRHLSESQRAMVAVKLETMKHGDNQYSKGDANLHVPREDAAKLLNVSPRTIATAAAVQRHATPELQRAVEQGHVAVSAARERGAAHTAITN